jgi:hypothetical protein
MWFKVLRVLSVASKILKLVSRVLDTITTAMNQHAGLDDSVFA